MSIRAFIAVPLPEDVKGAIHSLGRELVEEGLRIRLVRPEGIHCTLRFLGDITGEQVEEIGSAMEIAAREAKPVRLVTSGPGVFPNPARARVIWVGITGDLKPVESIYDGLQKGLESLGFEREKRGFSPHLTIGRWRNPLNTSERELLIAMMERYREWTGGGFDLKELVLYRSQLHSSGAKYTPLLRVPIIER